MTEPRFCGQCGAAWTAQARFCGQCGAQSPDQTVLTTAAPIAPAHADAAQPALLQSCAQSLPPVSEEAIAWQVDVPFLGNRFLRAGLVNATIASVVLAALFVGGLLTFASKDISVGLTGAAGASVVTLILFGIGILGFLIIVGFYQPLAYRMTETGIVMLNASRAAKGVHRAALITGLLTGKHAGVAFGVSARASETRSCNWASARLVGDYPAENTIIITGGFLSTIQIFCTPQNYAQVRDFIKTRIKPAA